MANIIRIGGGAPRLTGDATAADVKSGKTFYSDDPKNKLTGTSTAVRWAEVEVTWSSRSTMITGLAFTPAYICGFYTSGIPVYGSAEYSALAGNLTAVGTVTQANAIGVAGSYSSSSGWCRCYGITELTNNGDGTVSITIDTYPSGSSIELPTTLRLYES